MYIFKTPLRKFEQNKNLCLLERRDEEFDRNNIPFENLIQYSYDATKTVEKTHNKCGEPSKATGERRP